MTRFVLALMVSLGTAVTIAAQDKKPDAPPPPPFKPQVEVIGLSAKAAAPGLLMKIRLLPDPDELTPGNAAALWRQAYLAAREAKIALGEKEYKWITPKEVALADLPKKEIRDHLDKAKIVLRLAEQAARRTMCDWDYPPLTIQSIPDGIALGLNEVQMAREMAALLSLQFRYQLAEKKYDDAARTLQTGFALARHLEATRILIHNLVGVAISSIMLGRVEEWMAQPDAPNLYWALTAMPNPLLSARPAAEHELNTFLRSFPQLKEADKPGMTAVEAQKLLTETAEGMAKFGSPDGEGAFLAKLSAAVMVPMYIGEAKKYLTTHGRKAEDLEAMPAAQVVLIWFGEQYVRERDDILKWFMLPSWQALAGLEEVDKREKELRKKVAGTNVLQGMWALRLLMPAVLKVFEANLRLERHIATLRTVEAIRLHAAQGGKLPKKLSDVTDVPLPVDPRTGKGFDEFFTADGDKAVLEVHMMPNVLIRHYELK